MCKLNNLTVIKEDEYYEQYLIENGYYKQGRPMNERQRLIDIISKKSDFKKSPKNPSTGRTFREGENMGEIMEWVENSVPYIEIYGKHVTTGKVKISIQQK